MPASQPMNITKWSAFPATYRAAAVAEILHWITLGESGVVIGGSGTGKSNMAGYLAARPDVTSQYLPEPIANYCFLTLDLNGLPVMTTANFYRSLLFTIEEALSSDPDLSQRMSALLQRIPHPEDILALYLALQRAHQLLIQQAGKQVIWLFDRFDEGCVHLAAATLNSLRNLRDQFKDRLSYVTFTRCPLARLRNPAEFDEFHELMVMHTCWIGPMNALDGRWVAQQVETRYRKALPEGAQQLLFALCGGLPAFLKVAYSALASGELSERDNALQLQRKLLALPAFQRNCQEIWQSCTAEEQATLRLLAAQGSGARVRKTETHYLQQMGWLVPTPEGAPTIFAPVFADYIGHLHEPANDGIVIRNGAVYQDGVPLVSDLTALEYRLLEYLCRHAGEKVCTKEELDGYLWPEETNSGGTERLTQLVKRLRKKIGDDEKAERDRYIRVVHGRGYQFVQPATGR